MADINEADPRGSGTYRAAVVAVILLSVLLVAALIAVVAGFVRQAKLYHSGRAVPVNAVSADILPSAASIVLAPGSHIVSAATDAGKLVLHVRTRAGSEVDIFDLASGRQTAQVKDGAQ